MTVRTGTFPLRLPRSLKSAIEKLAEEDGVSMNQFLVVAAAEKVSALETEAYFSERRGRADREAFLRILNREGGAEPEAEDLLPEGASDGRRG
jgi:HicB family